ARLGVARRDVDRPNLHLVRAVVRAVDDSVGAVLSPTFVEAGIEDAVPVLAADPLDGRRSLADLRVLDRLRRLLARLEVLVLLLGVLVLLFDLLLAARELLVGRADGRI